MENKSLNREIAFNVGQYSRERRYWLDKFSDRPARTSFPYDWHITGEEKKIGNEKAHGNQVIKFAFSPGLNSRLMFISNGADTRLFMILAAALAALLYKYSQQPDIIFGIPIEKQEIQGEFINTILALRNTIHEEMTFKELLYSIRQTIIEAGENLNYPIESLPYDLNLSMEPVDRDRTPDSFPLFDTAILLENIHDRDYLNIIKLNMVFALLRSGESITGLVEYNPGIYKWSGVERIITHYRRLLEAVLSQVDLKIDDIDLLSPQEREELLVKFNHTAEEYPADKPLHQLFRDQVQATPGHIAVVETESNRFISYRLLDERANQLAHWLQQKGVRPGTIAAIMGKRDIGIITGVFAILKAGGAYLPLDAQNPFSRVKFILQDSSARIVLTQKHLEEEKRELFQSLEPGSTAAVDDPGLYQGSTSLPDAGCSVFDPAYVIYTSGTTGQPKGVVIGHRSAVNYISWAARNYVENRQVNFPLYSSFSFDMTVTSIFTPLITGNAVILYHGQYGEFLIDTITRENRVEVIKLTPSQLKMIKDAANNEARKNSIRQFIVGGEELDSRLALDIHRQYQGNAAIFNEYGPTEATVGCMLYRYDPGKDNGKSVSIGTPAANTRVYLLDRKQKPVPPGIAGEIHISGDGLAAGYLNRPVLTAEKFIPDPFAPGQRMYKTGDLGHWTANGNMEFLGRIDYQVKIRGFRIEPGEIQRHIIDYNGIKQALVLVKQDKTGDKYLCAYFVPGPSTYDLPAIREFLSRRLPDYMIPSFFVPLEKIPVTPGGKVDRKALPDPELEVQSTYTPPRNPTEKQMVKIWSDLLGLDEKVIGIDADFFNLGGHSLKATVLAARIQKQWNIKVSLVEIFENFTIRRLSQCIQQIVPAAEDRYKSIRPVEKKDYYELSSAQKRLYILQQMDPANSSYNMPSVIPLAEYIDIDAIKITFSKLVARHESLRTSIEMIDERPRQRVHDTVELDIDCRVLESKSPHQGVQSRLEALLEKFITPFDLSRAPFLRVQLIDIVVERRFLIFLDMHHIITDGISQEILRDEFMAIYNGASLEPLRLQYKDYSQWMNSESQQGLMKAQEQYWLNRLSGELPVLNLPTDFKRPVIQDFAGAKEDFLLNETETAAIKTMAKDNNLTLYMALLSMFTILLSKLSGLEDIIIGTPIAARRHSDLDRIVGMFVNTLVMRNYPCGDKNFKEFTREISQRTLEDYENQEYQFDDLVDRLAIPRDTSRGPVFDILLDLSSREESYVKTVAQEQEKKRIRRKIVTKFDMTLSPADLGETIFLDIEYCTKLFKSETILRFFKYFRKIVSTVTTDIGIKISAIEIMDESEKKQVLYEFNDTGVDFSREGRCMVHGLFEEQVCRTPDHIAVVGISPGRADDSKAKAPQRLDTRDTRQQYLHLTYNELNKKANRVAHLLQKKGVGPDVVVGIMVERSLEMIAALLAVLKAGGAYLPLDPHYPPGRIQYMLAESSAGLLLTTGALVEEVDRMGNANIILMENVNEAEEGNPSIFPAPASLVYIIYTSGSTGKPRGVMLEHQNLVNLLLWGFRFTNLDFGCVLQFATINFDASAHEIFSTLLYGGKLCLINNEMKTNIPGLFRIIRENEIKTLFLPISLLKIIFSEEEYIEKFPICVNHIQTAGEQVVISDRFKDYLKENKTWIHNHYGPSEAHVVTALTLEPTGEIPTLPPIGCPVSNTAIYILDTYRNVLPVGVPGELYIGGIQVGRGYLNNPGLTADKFDQDLWDYRDYRDEKKNENYQKFFRGSRGAILQKSSPGRRRLYKTGDRARWQPDGNIEFLGRLDFQVKIRGFRVELGEIEAHLLNHPAVKEAVITCEENVKNDRYLCAYIGVGEGVPGSIDPMELRNYLSRFVPDYMIPSYFLQMEKLPLTSNGKIDRKKLPAPGIEVGGSYVAPRDEIEKRLAAIWAEVLEIEKNKIGINDNFFHLGGHSLKAVILTARIHKTFQVGILMIEIFKTPTLREIASLIQAIKKNDRQRTPHRPIEPVEKKEYYPLTPSQSRLYILQQIEEKSNLYNMPVTVPLEPGIRVKRLEDIFKQLIQRHEGLRTCFQVLHGKPVQQVQEEVHFEIASHTVKESEVKPLMRQMAKPFALEEAPLLRAAVINIEGARQFLVFEMNHVISDGISMEILKKEFEALYRGEGLPPLKLQYKDYAQWQNSAEQIEVKKQQEKYWLNRFKRKVTGLNLPLDFPRPRVRNFEGTRREFFIGPRETGMLKALIDKQDATMFMIILAVYNVLLTKLSGQEDIVVGAAAAGRDHADLENIVGVFVKVLPLRNYPQGEKTFIQFLEEVKQNTIDAFDNQAYPFEDLIEKVMDTRDAGRNPLFDTMFTLQNFSNPREYIEAKEPSSVPRVIQYEYLKSKFDLNLNGYEIGNQVKFVLEYRTSLFKEDTINRFSSYFKKIVSAVLANPTQKLSELEITPAENKKEISSPLEDDLENE
jgi:amino acid adenylation domain-containing protein